MSKILHLTLKKEWFDKIASGEKKKEYRGIKNYWHSRLLDMDENGLSRFRKFDYIIFKNGYGKNAPTIKTEHKGTRFGYSEVFDKMTYIIMLGKVI